MTFKVIQFKIITKRVLFTFPTSLYVSLKMIFELDIIINPTINRVYKPFPILINDFFILCVNTYEFDFSKLQRAHNVSLR